ncbi:MAG: hypothetical protein ACUVTX_11565, partial [Bacteroidales bacterium]
YVFNYLKNNPRPVNSTKIYGSDRGNWLDRGITTKHAVETFCRNIVGGFAASRFHRPPSGLGLSNTSINCMKTIRKIEEKVKFRDMIPRMDLIGNKGENKAYITAKEGESYVIYFTKPGMVTLDLTSVKGPFSIEWISVEKAEWDKKGVISSGKTVEITSEYSGDAFAVLKRKR